MILPSFTSTVFDRIGVDLTLKGVNSTLPYLLWSRIMRLFEQFVLTDENIASFEFLEKSSQEYAMG